MTVPSPAAIKPVITHPLNVIVATDCGSTTTKAILIEKVGDDYRQTYRGEAPTTVEAPFEDVTRGVLNAIAEVEELSGRKILDGDQIITPARCEDWRRHLHLDQQCGRRVADDGGRRGAEHDGGERTTGGAGRRRDRHGRARVQRRPFAAREDRAHPDTAARHDPDVRRHGRRHGHARRRDGRVHCRRRAAAPVRGDLQAAGHLRRQQGRAPQVKKILGEKVALVLTDNLRPVLERENLAPARDKIHDLFLEHVMAQAPGYDKLIEWTDAPIMPTPARSATSWRRLRKREHQRGRRGHRRRDDRRVQRLRRRVQPHGQRQPRDELLDFQCLAEAGCRTSCAGCPSTMDERELRNRVKNKMIRPTTIPQTLDELQFEQAVAREALRLAYIQHKEFATTLKGVQQQRTIGDIFDQQQAGKTLIDMMKLDLLVGTGGMLSHAPRRVQSMLMMIDAFEPGVSRRSRRTASS